MNGIINGFRVINNIHLEDIDGDNYRSATEPTLKLGQS